MCRTMAQYYSSSCLLFFLSMYNSLDTLYTQCSTFTGKLYTGINNAFTEKVYFLLENISTPFLVKSINISAYSSAVPDWYYSLDRKYFIRWKLNTSATELISRYDSHYLPILSMEVLEGDAIMHDLTDYVGSIKVFAPGKAFFPSIAHIIGAWSLSSGIVIDTTRDFKIRLIDMEGNTLIFSTDSYDCFEEVSKDDEGMSELDSEILEEVSQTITEIVNASIAEVEPEVEPMAMTT